MLSQAKKKAMVGRQGFTLVELLVVITIISILIALLLPALAVARTDAGRVACQANMRSVAQAFIAYCQSNNDYFPAPAIYGYPLPADWVYWESNRNLNDSRLAPYLTQGAGSHFNPAVLLCPADVYAKSRAAGTWGGAHLYPFSYTLNLWLGGPDLGGTSTSDYGMYSLATQIKKDMDNNVPPNFSDTYFSKNSTFAYARVTNPSGCIMLEDQSDFYLNDGAFYPNDPSDTVGNRHNGGGEMPPIFTSSGTAVYGQLNAPLARGNVAFVDGHVGYVTRLYESEQQWVHMDPYGGVFNP